MQETPEQKLADRVRLIGAATAVLILLGWLAWFYPFDNLLDLSGTPWGGDFPTFYIAGRMMNEGNLSQLYDTAEHQRRLQALAPGIDPAYCLPYRYPPAFALVMAPWGWLPYAGSSTLFALVSIVLVLVSIAILLHTNDVGHSRWRTTAWWGAATAPLVLESIISGQLTPIALIIVAVTVMLLNRDRQIAAGAVLALALYKPNVLALFGLVCLLRYPRMVLGGAPVAALWGLASLLLVGVEGTLGYLRLGSQLALDDWSIQAPPHKMHGLAGWLDLLATGHGRQIVLGLGVVAACWVVYRWRRAGSDAATSQIALASALALNALGNPYVPIYDLALLMPAALLMTSGLIRRYGEELKEKLLPAELLLGSVYFGPHLSQAVALRCGWQLFPLLLLAIVAWQFRELYRASRGACRCIGTRSIAIDMPRATAPQSPQAQL